MVTTRRRPSHKVARVRQSPRSITARARCGAECPACGTPYINPGSVAKRFSARELEVLEKAPLNRVCLACGFLYRIFKPKNELVSVEGFDPEGDHRLFPIRSNGDVRHDRGWRTKFGRRLTRAHEVWVERMRGVGYTVTEIAERLLLTEERVAEILSKEKSHE